jgi:ribonuclease III
MSKRPSNDGDEAATRKKPRSDVTQQPSFPTLSPLLVEPWRAADIPSELPPLPKIHDPEIESQVFRHPGLAGGPSYERLEWLGDAYLEMIATSLIFQTFTRTPSGRCSQIREQLIRNVTLAEYFRNYKMDQKAKLPQDVAQSISRNPRGRSSDKDLIKTQGDMFEAYVAGIIVSDPDSNGLAVAANWLRKLFSTTIKDQIIRNETETQYSSSGDGRSSNSQPHFPPKDQLTRLIGGKGVVLEYRDLPGSGEQREQNLGLPLYTVGVFLTGWGEEDRLLGTGTALKKKEAGQNAARKALGDKEAMKTYETRKQAAWAERMKETQADTL